MPATKAAPVMMTVTVIFSFMLEDWVDEPSILGCEVDAELEADFELEVEVLVTVTIAMELLLVGVTVFVALLPDGADNGTSATQTNLDITAEELALSGTIRGISETVVMIAESCSIVAHLNGMLAMAVGVGAQGWRLAIDP